MNNSTLTVRIYEEDGAVVLECETEDGSLEMPMTVSVAEELCDRLRDCIAETRTLNPGVVQ